MYSDLGYKIAGSLGMVGKGHSAGEAAVGRGGV